MGAFDVTPATKRLKSILGDQQLTMNKLQGVYRNYLRKKPNTTAFATLNGSSALGKRDRSSDEETDVKPETKRTARKCVCGAMHEYRKCWYLFPENAPKWWRPLEEKETAIRQSITGAKPACRCIEKMFKNCKEKTPGFLKNVLFSKEADKHLKQSKQSKQDKQNKVSDDTVAFAHFCHGRP
jgi:hypothetical protein